MNIVIASQMLGTAFACGLNLYATIALLGIASRLGWVPALPPGMAGLEHGLVIGSALILYVVEFVMDRVPLVDHVWEAAHTIIRPAAAGLLATLALHSMPLHIQLAGATAAAAVALTAHGTKAGLRVILAARTRDSRVKTVLRSSLSVVEDVAAACIVLAAMIQPQVGARAMVAAAALLLLGGPRLWRASALALRAIHARALGFFGERQWRNRDHLPRAVRAAIPGDPPGHGPARVAQAAVTGLPGVGEFRNGWLVFTCDGPRFLYRALFRTRSAALPPAMDVRLRRGLVTDALELIEPSNGKAGRPAPTIYLLKNGPRPHVAAAELTAAAAIATSLK